MIRKQYFNMVEIALAIAIIGLGALSIMSLFPVGMSAGNAAVADNTIPDAAETLLAYIEGAIQADWRDTDGVQTASNAMLTALGTSKASNVPGREDAGYTVVSNMLGIRTHGTGPFFLFDKSITLPTREITDFSAVAQVWRDATLDAWIDADFSGIDAAVRTRLKRNAARVFVEISWPADRPYERREKRIYTLELYNQAFSPAATP